MFKSTLGSLRDHYKLMQKLIRLLGIFIMLSSTNAIAAKPSFILAKTANEVLNHLDKLPQSSIIFFDIDDTIITPASKTFRVKPYNQLIDDIKKNKEQYTNYHEIVSNWRLQRKIMLLDENWPIVINQLKTRFPIYALTKMDSGKFGNIESIEQWRYNELKSLKIEFSENKHIVSNIGFLHGIFYTSTLSKSQTLAQYLPLLDATTIVLVDDRLEHLEDVEKFCDSHNIKFIGILFKGLETLTDKPDPAIAEFQKQHLIKNAQWLEDDEAQAKMDEKK